MVFPPHPCARWPLSSEAPSPYGSFCVAPGHQLGFNDLKTIEIRDYLLAIAGEPVRGPDFREGWEVQKVVDAIIRSSRERGWVAVG